MLDTQMIKILGPNADISISHEDRQIIEAAKKTAEEPLISI